MPTVYSPAKDAYTALQTITLGSNQASVTFGSIPTTDVNGNNIRDLILIMDYKASSALFAGKAYINSDTTSSNYAWARISGGSGGQSATETYNAGSIRWDVQTTGNAMAVLEFIDAKATDKHKVVFVRQGAADTGTLLSGNKWLSTNAVTSITINFGTNLLAGSVLSLYGVAA